MKKNIENSRYCLICHKLKEHNEKNFAVLWCGLLSSVCRECKKKEEENGEN